MYTDGTGVTIEGYYFLLCCAGQRVNNFLWYDEFVLA
jgi:hypothetical protein